MPINERVEDQLPRFTPVDPTPQHGGALIARSEAGDREWRLRHADDDPDAPKPVWLSEAGKCARRISYRLHGVEGEPMDDHGRHVVEIGNLIHAAIQEAFPEEQVEIPVQGTDADGVTFLTGRVDCVTPHVDIADADEVVDYKSAAAYGFKLKQTEGPDWGDILQIGLAMKILDVAYGRLVYVAKERMSPRDTKSADLDDDSPRRVAVEYPFHRGLILEQLEREWARLRRIYDLAADGELAPRSMPFEMPPGARVTAPKSGAWARFIDGVNGPELAETGKLWACGYCPFQDRCQADLEQEEGAS